MMEEPTIFVVDDDDRCRESMCALVAARGFVTESYRSGEEFLATMTATDRTGCLVTDYKMGGMTGLDLQEELAARDCDLPVIVVSGHANVSVAVRVMTAGAVTLLEKPHSEEQLMGAIDRAVHRSSRLRAKRTRKQSIRENWSKLDCDERDVARMLVSGYANKVIATKQVMGLRTVERRRHDILKKMDVRTVPQLARLVAILEEEDVEV